MSDVTTITIRWRSVRTTLLAAAAFTAIWITGAALSELTQAHQLVFLAGALTGIIASDVHSAIRNRRAAK